jgi:NADH-quinone oxidoreductase subunit G
MVKITINGKEYQVEPKGNLLETCLSLGFDIPHFCYHPAMGSVGACRLCAVKRFRDANDQRGRIIMSCMEPVTEGMLIGLDDEDVKQFRRQVIESLMTNHPHDCPVCDEGGECQLQDMVYMTGHDYRRFEFKKNTYKNQDLGPYVNHEMNRCIQCYRCVRFYKDYAGGKDFGVYGVHNHLYFGRFEDGKLESPFSGNLVEVCPTGVFTDKKLKKKYTRKWDLTYAPTICNNCSTGCNMIIGQRYAEVRRIVNRYNSQINGFFICDKGRFEYDFIHANNRIKLSALRKGKNLGVDTLTKKEITEKTVKIISSDKVMGIGSPIASVEANFALQKLVGKENFYAGVSQAELDILKEVVKIYQSKEVPIASLKDIETSEAVIVLGQDVAETAPRIELTIRQSLKNEALKIGASLNIPEWNANAVKNAAPKVLGPLVNASNKANLLDEISSVKFNGNAENIISFGKALIAAFSGKPLKEFSSDIQDKVNKVVEQLKNCASVSVITGTQLMNKEVINTAFAIAKSLISQKKVNFYCVVPECNSLAMAILADKGFDSALAGLIQEGEYNLFVLENNLFQRTESANLEALDKIKHIIVLDHNTSEMTEKADVILASGTYAESEGTLINSEGRMQRYFRVLPPDEHIQESWKWLADIYAMKNNSASLDFDGVVNEVAAAYPVLAGIKEIAPNEDFRIFDRKVPRQTLRFTGRTAINTNINVHEPKPFEDENSPLAFTMEGGQQIPPEPLVSFYWSPKWNSWHQSLYTKYINTYKGQEGIRIFDK